MKGRLHSYYNTKFQTFVARSWPSGNGGDTPARAISRALFKQLIHGVSNPNQKQKQEAIRISDGTPFTWRDVMMSASYGNLYISVADDGSYWMGWRLAFATIQVLLDSIENAPGAMLVRAPEGWVVLLPGADGDVLTFSASAGIPQWESGTADVQTVLNQLAPNIGDMIGFDGSVWNAVDPSTLFDPIGAAATAQTAAEAYAAALVAALTIPSGSNPTATASDTAVNGVSTSFMRADASPAIQKASSTQFGLVKVDGSTVTSVGGVISASGFLGTAGAYSPGYQSGVFYGAPAALLGSTTGFSANTMYAVPFYVGVQTTFTKQACVGSSAAGNVRLGIYDNSTGVPGSLLYDNGTVALASGFTSISGLNLVLAPGWYWLVLLADSARTLWYTNFTSSSNPLLTGMFGYTNTSTLKGPAYTRAFTYGALPNAFGTPVTLNSLCPFQALSL